jgi:MFS transporter, OFA family, oxalate/formate antiporter
MLCMGSVYAWSVIASELIENYAFSGAQSQAIFGVLIAIFPVTMIFAGQLGETVRHRHFGYIAAFLFFTGYFVAGSSQGNFILMLIGIGVLGGLATGFGYWVSLTSPVLWFPEKKGLITGIAAAGFGLGAVFMSRISEALLDQDYNVLQLLRFVGIFYGLIVVIMSNFIYHAPNHPNSEHESVKVSYFIGTSTFRKLFLGIFLGTFAGLLIIGSLMIIGEKFGVSSHTLVLGVGLFAIANFSGRLAWGFISDHTGANFSIFLALLVQSVSIFLLAVSSLSAASYLITASLIGFGFGGNFVLFARETAQLYGVKNLGKIYPYVFIGYAIAGIAGPISGGLLYDLSGGFFHAIILAGLMSFFGSMLFLNHYIKESH